MPASKRKYIDCRDFPNDIGCTLKISGNEDEVLIVALKHAVDEHGHKNTPELKKMLKKLLKTENSNKERN